MSRGLIKQDRMRWRSKKVIREYKNETRCERLESIGGFTSKTNLWLGAKTPKHIYCRKTEASLLIIAMYTYAWQAYILPVFSVFRTPPSAVTELARSDVSEIREWTIERP